MQNYRILVIDRLDEWGEPTFNLYFHCGQFY